MKAGAAWVAWSLCALYLVLAVVSQILLVVNGRATFWEALAWKLVFLLFAAIGALIASRQPGNAIGWILSAIGLFGVIDYVPTQYAIYALFTAPGSLPAGELMAWLQSWLWAPGFGLFGFLLLLFPDGKLPSRRWRPTAWVTGGACATLAVGMALKPGGLGNREIFQSVANPFGLEGFPGEVTAALAGGGFVVLNLCLLLAAASMVRRFRRASGDERQQLKWFAFAAALVAVGFVANFTYQFLLIPEGLQQAMLLVAEASVPLAVGIAVLKHRLYDIDLLINRALVYGTLTAALGLLYWGGVVLFQQLLRPLTQASELAVIGSTLAVAALFQPARRRVQELVDRRFYRRRYDATRTLEAFGARLRHEVDLDAMAADLRAVAWQTVQPTHVSLWLRPRERKA
ncbi:MAG TPA: hypothetical protein VGM69_21120 [Chloroflexota bacterium]|jgi:hypothetical protein